MNDNKPIKREKNNTTGTGSVKKRGDGLGTGPVGKTDGRKNTDDGKKGDSNPERVRSAEDGKKAPKSKLSVIIGAIVLLLGGGGAGLAGLVGGGGGQGNGPQNATSMTAVDTTVAEGSRAKRTEILGDGKDVVTIMVYMCGTDLESEAGMATSDINEMLAADISDNINLIIYTGGCKQWKTAGISNTVNQIYRIHDGKLECLEADMGNSAMTKADNLTEFINYCATNYPANRNELIFWDHGGGSLSGYGYDETHVAVGSMNLERIDRALNEAGVTFDFIGFDACLMATLENGLMLSKYADYLIASEETEPGVGWYYTNWLTELSGNTSMATTEIGKNIIDDFVDVCAEKCRGQQTTLSIVDLAELEYTVPDKLSAFASSTSELIKNSDYKTVSDARYNTREFAQSSRIDQVDIVNLADNMGTPEAAELSAAVKGAVKYNRTSSNMTNAYGISVYFPYKQAGKVKDAVKINDSIGVNSEYTKCIQDFASLEANGQIVAMENTQSYSAGSLLGALIEGAKNSGLGDIVSGGRAMNAEDAAAYVEANSFDADLLVWNKDGDKSYIDIPQEQWELIHSVAVNVYIDDGEGYIDLGYDNTFEIEDNRLIDAYDGTWLSIDGQVVAYYFLDAEADGDNYMITGYVPVMLNDKRAELLLTFDNDNPDGYVSGVRFVYTDGSTDTVAKSMDGLHEGDKLDFICDYYSYDGTYADSYYLGDTITVGSEVTIANIDISAEKANVTYRLSDIYNQVYWTPVVE